MGIFGTAAKNHTKPKLAMTSTAAALVPGILVRWIPSPGVPKISLYLHKGLFISFFLRSFDSLNRGEAVLG